jgi:hypothetical protein
MYNSIGDFFFLLIKDNPMKKDTEDDPVEQMFSNLKNISGWDDSTEFTAGHPLALIMVKKLG